MNALQRLVDRTDIIEAKCAYARACDAVDADRMVALFVEDCVADYEPGAPQIVGRTALRDWYAGRVGAVASGSHHVSNFEATFLDDDTVELRSYVYSWQRLVGHPEVSDRHRWGRYLDRWVRTPDGWRQASLVYRLAGELADGSGRVGEYFELGF
jgi:ketosteroid isomerase-like protein